MTEGRTVVIGVGSPLMGDDGVGVRAAHLLRERAKGVPGLSVLDGGTWGMQLLPAIEDARRLLLLDAIRDGREPGSIVRLEGDEIPRFLSTKVSPHQIDLREVLAAAELLGTLPEEMVALGVEPDVVEMRSDLSPVVRRAMGGLVEACVAQLVRWGHPVSGAQGVGAGA